MQTSPLPCKKVLFILPILGPGGSETSLLNVARAFARNGHHVEIIIERDRPSIAPPEGIKMHYLFEQFLGGSGNKHIREILLKRLVRKLDKGIDGYDLILSNYVTSRPFVEKYFPDKVHYWVHFDYQHMVESAYQVSKKKGDKLSNKIRGYFNNKNIIPVSHGAHKTLLNMLKVKPRSAKVIYNMFDVDGIREKSLAPVKDLPKQPFVVHVARFDLAQKRQDVLLDAFKLVNHDDYMLVLLTEPSQALSDMITSRGLDKRVIVAGFQANPYPWVRAAELLVLCSDFEGLPMSLIESIICGTEIVSSDCPSGPKEILVDELANNLVPMRDPAALASKINQRIDHERTAIDFDKHVEKFSEGVLFSQFYGLITAK